MAQPKYHRVLLKISGEALAGDAHRGLDFDVIGSVCDVVKQCRGVGRPDRYCRRRRQFLARPEGRRCAYGAHPGRPYGYAGDGHQCPGRCRLRWSSGVSRCGSRRPSRWTASQSPTSAARPSAIWRRAGSSSSAAARATRSSRPTRGAALRAVEIGRRRDPAGQEYRRRLLCRPGQGPRLPSNMTPSPMMRFSAQHLAVDGLAPRLPFLWIITCPIVALCPEGPGEYPPCRHGRADRNDCQRRNFEQ